MLFTENESLSWAHPLVQEWFISKFTSPTQPQIQGWPTILAEKNTLIAAPTGTGKTLAAFLVCIDRLICKALTGELNNQTEILYISPLKALNNDIQKNLIQPLAEIFELAAKYNLFPTEINILVRTGDTPMRERQAMLKKPPHILITTPESLYILLTAEKSRAMLTTINTVIVDEIHALVNNKRGSHLTLSLARLEALTKKSFVRIGLSATQKPIEIVGQFLVGNAAPLPVFINIGHLRDLDVAIEVPASELSAVTSYKMWDEIYNRIAELVKQNRSTLVFVNTRRLSERMAHCLRERLGKDSVAAHHGSLSRKLRLAAETKLKHGELKVLVATASLELGIDIGTVDLVCQIGSPRSIAIALQRIGRAGHWKDAISKGRIFVTTRNELLECAALVYAIKTGDLDQLTLPFEPLDILAQQIIAACSAEEWQTEDLFKLVKKSYPYSNLARASFDDLLKMLSDGVAGSRGRYGAFLFYDKVNERIIGRRGSRLNAIMNGGSIPDNGLFTVLVEPGAMVGTLDEDFAIDSHPGDIILLGTTSWKIKRIESAAGRVLVEDAHGAPPSVPFWRGEAPARTNELSLQVSNLMAAINSKLPIQVPAVTNLRQQPNAKATIQWLKKNCGLTRNGAEQLMNYVLTGRAALGNVPTQKTIIAERFFDESGGMQLIIHSSFGARINKAWGLALRKRFCRSFNFELQAAATDDGINIALTEQHSFPLADVFHFLHPNTLKDVLVQAVLQSPLFTTRWRWVAIRSLVLKRFRNGKKVPPNIQRMLANDLLAAVFPDAAACQDNLAGCDVKLPSHPLIDETMKETLTEALDVDGLIKIMTDIRNGAIQCLAVDTPLPSTFSHEILNANPYAFLDDAPLEERRARAVELRQTLPQAILEEIGKLDLACIQEVEQQAWPDIRNADELQDLLQTLIAFPAHKFTDKINDWPIYFDQLLKNGRATIADFRNTIFWITAEKIKTFTALYPTAILQTNLALIQQDEPNSEDALVILLRGWLMHLGPTTSQELSAWLAMDNAKIDIALLQLESSGYVLRGHFKALNKEQIEWCERRILARIHRLTLGKLRKEIEPVTANQFLRWLIKWQHLAPTTQLSGEHSLLEIIAQLQGFEMPANAWERQIFAKRIKNYESSLLDKLCFSGVIGWGRLSPHPLVRVAETLAKPINPTSIVPITFFVREQAEWRPNTTQSDIAEILPKISSRAQKIYHYLDNKGASFLMDIARGITCLESEVETGLWELVAAGLVTADSFDNLRSLINPARRASHSIF